jgi:hypothetical protein
VVFGSALTVGLAFFALQADTRFLGTRWGHPGPAVAVKYERRGDRPGEATYSYMPADIKLAPIARDDVCIDEPVTLDFSELLPNDANGARAKQLFDRAVTTWVHAINYHDFGISIRKVDDGGGEIGGPIMDSNVGDIRAGVSFFKSEAALETQPGQIDNVLAHAFAPNTANSRVVPEQMDFGSIGGDIHFRPNEKFYPKRGIKWVDDPAASKDDIDLLTVMIHEVGHALGLADIVGDDTSVMSGHYKGAKRILSQSDVKNIRELYNTAKP